jgi:hypothetical protein
MFTNTLFGSNHPSSLAAFLTWHMAVSGQGANPKTFEFATTMPALKQATRAFFTNGEENIFVFKML